MMHDLFKSLITQAMHAPSVHNVQPARWHIEPDAIVLVEDLSRRLNVGDPSSNDANISLGAAAEGLKIAAAMQQMVLLEDTVNLPKMPEPFRSVVRYRLTSGGSIDPLGDMVQKRASWRAPFAPVSHEDRVMAAQLAADDVVAVSEPSDLKALAKMYDAASYGFMHKREFRAELLSWMRLKRHHPNWSRDGLNADAMALNRLEAIGAGWVLGAAFGALDRIGLAAPMLAEGSKITAAAGVIIFHRPLSESAFDSGRHFYRLWLKIEAAGFGAAVLAALADDHVTAKKIMSMHNIKSTQRVVSAFRIGRRTAIAAPARARLTLSDVLV
jgi:hypothetical protein